MDTTTVKQAIIARIDELTRIATYMGLRYPAKTIHDFSLRGRCAGQYVYSYIGVTTSFTKSVLRWNLDIAKNNLQDYLNTTVPHELAHAIQKYHYPTSQPHGAEWRRLCVALVGHELPRCHSFDVTLARKTKRYTYTCNCDSKTHNISSVIHNRIMKGRYYRCNDCYSRIVLQSNFAVTH